MCAAALSPVQAADKAQPQIAATVKLADWQLARLDDLSHIPTATDETRKTRGWEQAVFWVGMTALADAGAPPRIKQAIMAMGDRDGWRPGDNLYFADDQAIAQAYLWAAKNGAGPGPSGRQRRHSIQRWTSPPSPRWPSPFRRRAMARPNA
ncbi:hypothetical protein [Sphingobium sp.]|uniref:hypothetical protein n=1 Tax=Sphingobium sp. TaxID=1912891 RepID=UPI003B3B83B9